VVRIAISQAAFDGKPIRLLTNVVFIATSDAYWSATMAESQHTLGKVKKTGSRVKHAAAGAVMGELRETLDLLGGPRILGSAILSELDAHELLHKGLPRAALRTLVDRIHLITADEAFEALGVSLRTLQRHKSEPDALLDVQQSGRAWNFAGILAKATRVLGSQDEAEQWLRRPASGLDQQRPIDLLTTPAGVKLVEGYLGRLEYDVYT
jgi:putative toxin-antitoxin system antitoxin component (TIGR02293 family)